MTEKRFQWIYIKDNTLELRDNGIVKRFNNERLEELLNELHEERNYFERKKWEYWNKFNLAHLDNINLRKENEKLKKELFEERKDYILETYADNPIRRDEKLKALEKEYLE